jgi:hypothetical protein
MSDTKYQQLPFFDYLEDCCVSLDCDFRKYLLEEARKKAGSWRALAKLVGAPERHVVSNWKTCKVYEKRRLHLGKLLTCCSLVGIKKETLVKHINAATMRYPSGDLTIKGWNIVLDEGFAEWLGMLNGDGSVGDRHLFFHQYLFWISSSFFKSHGKYLQYM